MLVSSLALLATILLFGGCGTEDTPDELSSVAGAATSGVGYAGFDISTYPGKERMAWLKQPDAQGNPRTNLRFAGYCLAPAPHRTDLSWMGVNKNLAGTGWGFLPTYLGKQQEATPSYASDLKTLSRDSGLADGKTAAALMASESFPQGRVVYLDVEKTGTPQNSPLDPRMVEYYKGWIEAVVIAGYTPGVYCSYRFADILRAADNRPLFWVFQINDYACRPSPASTQLPSPNPASSGISYATVWQLQQECSLQLSDGRTSSTVKIDYDVSTTPDPSFATVIPTIPTARAPSNQQTINGSTVYLSWQRTPTTLWHQMFVALQQAGGGWNIYGPFTTTAASPFGVNGIPNNAQAAWTTFACNWAGCSPQADWQYFIHGK